MEPHDGFEAALQQLEQTVEQIEGGDLGLDAALAAFERGVRLLSRCHGLLDGAERRVALLTGVDADGAPATAPFGASPSAEPGPDPTPPALP